MNKAVKYSINGALIAGGINAVLNLISQFNDLEPNQNIDIFKVLKSFGEGAIVGGVSGLALGALKDEQMEEALIYAGGTAGFIKKSLDKYSYNDTDLPKKATQLQQILYKKFGNFLSEYPTLSGSTQKGTATKSSDIDIHVKFNKEAGTLYEIRDLIEDFFDESYNDNKLLKIRSQEWSVGLFFKIKNEDKRIDIVPMREIENGNGDTFLYSKNKQTIKKTNAYKHDQVFRFTEKQKKIIILLKGWKKENDIKISSTYLELLVLRAFNEIHFPRGIDNTLLSMIDYIGTNITYLRLFDPANTNNVISDSLTYSEKEAIQSFCFKMLDEIRKDKRNVMDYFA